MPRMPKTRQKKIKNPNHEEKPAEEKEDEEFAEELDEEPLLALDEDVEIVRDYKSADELQKERIDKKKMREKDSDELKVAESVLDVETRTTLFELRRRAIIDRMTGVISTGKEANVYHGFAPDGKELAIKIYRTSASYFKRFQIYIIGDPRFKKIKRDQRGFVHAWAQKEYKNLKRAAAAGVSVPKPIFWVRDVVVMEFLGKDGLPYRIMKEQEVYKPKKTYKEVLTNIRRLYKKARLVHADLSEYNIIYTPKVYLIDISQAVLLEHPYSEIFLYRDLKNITKYFSSIGAEVHTPEELFEELVGEPPSDKVKAYQT